MARLRFEFGRRSICRRSRPAAGRRGAIAVLAAVLIVITLVMAAFAIDVGVICMAKAELQRTADAAALAATDELLHQVTLQPGQTSTIVTRQNGVIQGAAASTALLNQVVRQSPNVALNPTNDQAGEIVMGELVRTANGAASLSFADPSQYNSVVVHVERTATQNGELPLFFGRVLGLNTVASEAHAQAAFLQNFQGFRAPSGNDDPPPNLMFLPFAIDRTSWQDAENGTGPDDYSYDKDAKTVGGGSDGIHEVSLYPLSTGASGNFGTVDIGSDNSNTPTLKRQIVNGVTPDDLAFHGGSLSLDSSGKLYLSGDPGLKAGAIQHALKQIVGQPRIVPLYSSIKGNCQNATYTITGFAGCRVVDVHLTGGGGKHLTVQAAPMITRGGIPGSSGSSSQIYSPVVLVD
jgi:Flp pilus assembly protein TadG